MDAVAGGEASERIETRETLLWRVDSAGKQLRDPSQSRHMSKCRRGQARRSRMQRDAAGRGGGGTTGDRRTSRHSCSQPDGEDGMMGSRRDGRDLVPVKTDRRPGRATHWRSRTGRARTHYLGNVPCYASTKGGTVWTRRLRSWGCVPRPDSCQVWLGMQLTELWGELRACRHSTHRIVIPQHPVRYVLI